VVNNSWSMLSGFPPYKQILWILAQKKEKRRRYFWILHLIR